MAPSKRIFSAPAKAVDPTLDALFASSVGPVETRAKPKYEGLIEPKPRAAPKSKPVKPLAEDEEQENVEDSDEDEDDEESDDDSENEEDEDEEEQSAEEEAATTPVEVKSAAAKRKRKNRDEDDDLEGRYFDKLARETDDGPAEKKAKRSEAADGDEDEESSEDKEEDEDDDEDADVPIVHESLLAGGGADGAAADAAGGQDAEQEKEKASRTVFLSNVDIKAVTDKAAKKALMAHLASIFEDEPPSKKEKAAKEGEEAKEEAEEKSEAKEKPVVESLRFRSVPFATAALPKRAAYITGAVMGATAQSTNAYAVYSTAAAARLAVRKLNGTVVLDRHLRADSVAHPSPVDHRRCVFVGNLGFVDDETVLNNNPEADAGEDGEARKKRHKTPMDVEEGLWRTFGKKAGRVESVRVIRDAATRVGKGFAYVQFYDANAVEAALLLADKKFPPLLPRALRVSRCKAPHRTARAVERVQLKAGGGKPEGGRFPDRRDSRDKRGPRDGNGRDKKGAGTTTGYTPKLTAEQQTFGGRVAKLLGRSAATATAPGPDGKPLVFEGMRARVGHNLFKKGKGSKGGKGGKDGQKGGWSKGKPGSDGSKNQVRRAGRAANWRAKKGGDE